MFSLCQDGFCASFGRFITCRRPTSIGKPPQFSQSLRADHDSAVFPNDSLRAKLEQARDPETFLRIALEFEKKDQIRNILRLEKLIDHDVFAEKIAAIPDEVIRNEALVPRKYDQDSLLYLKLKAELSLKQAETRRLSTGESVVDQLRNYDYTHHLEILQETFSLFRKTLELFSFSFLDVRKDTAERILGKRIQVCKKLFFMVLRQFAVFICRLDYVKDERHLEELDGGVGQFFQAVDRFLITMSNLKVEDEEIVGIEELHKTNLKTLVSLTKAYCAAAAKKQSPKMYQTLDLIRIRFQQATQNKEVTIPHMEEEVAALAVRMDDYKAKGMLESTDPKRSKRAKVLSAIQETAASKDEDTDELSDSDLSESQDNKLSTIKELSSNYDDLSSKMDINRQNSFSTNKTEDLLQKMNQKHLGRTSFTLPKRPNYQ